MEIQYFGANCVRLSSKKATIVIDDNLSELGQKSITKSGDIALFTGVHGSAGQDVKITINQPGEYEVSNTSVTGIAARAHMDEDGTTHATMFKVVGEDVRIVVVGHIYPDLSDDQLEEIGMVDVLIVPVGGNGFTLDPVGALKVIRKISPKVVIPTHYADKTLDYQVPQQELSAVLQELGMEPAETVAKYKFKPGEQSDATQLVVLEKQ